MLAKRPRPTKDNHGIAPAKKSEPLAVHAGGEVRAEKGLIFQTGAEIAAERPVEIEYIVTPWVLAGGITEISGKVKMAGKTTFVTHMVSCVLAGIKFLGGSTTKTSAVYLTEQPKVSFHEMMKKAGLWGREDFIVLPWYSTVGSSWESVAQAAVDQCQRRGAKLLVIDTLPQFANIVGDHENNSGDAMTAMRPLQEAASKGIGVVVVRHERKKGGRLGDSSRGSSAFAGAMDVLISIQRPEGNTRPTLRTMKAVSRMGNTPEMLTIELTEEGYVSQGVVTDVSEQESKQAILAAMPGTESKAVTIEDLLAATKSSRATAQRVLEHLIGTDQICRVGNGRKMDPYRFYASPILSAQTTPLAHRTIASKIKPRKKHYRTVKKATIKLSDSAKDRNVQTKLPASI